ncbi:hypothetical protein [Tenacibaculum sp. M341]|uniref:hypothetical protein n=1 Tax=Tenacibaculum sp. M341 TaxID=2530339 RepID=UPI00104C418B|nr:hypothetical protein [Tenacibaculum sp. M341]TCI92791.1 hypothetical protein EYW44_07805 [Tenacibaculum sp. M341]
MKELKNIYEVLDFIKDRPSMFIGDNKITSLKIFLDGYQLSNRLHNIETELIFPPFYYFHRWIQLHFNSTLSTAGYSQIILQNNNNNEEKSLSSFFSFINDFKELRPVNIINAKLGELEISFHHSKQCKVKTIDPKTNEKHFIYKNADEIFIVEVSHSFGFGLFIKLNGLLIKDWIGYELFDTKQEAFNYANSLFGESLKWNYSKNNLDNLILYILKG